MAALVMELILNALLAPVLHLPCLSLQRVVMSTGLVMVSMEAAILQFAGLLKLGLLLSMANAVALMVKPILMAVLIMAPMLNVLSDLLLIRVSHQLAVQLIGIVLASMGAVYPYLVVLPKLVLLLSMVNAEAPMVKLIPMAAPVTALILNASLAPALQITRHSLQQVLLLPGIVPASIAAVNHRLAALLKPRTAVHPRPYHQMRQLVRTIRRL